MSGQSIVDRLNAAKHTVAGSALGRAVVKATTEEIMGPKRKHLEYLLACTSEINVSIPQMADLLIERTQNTSWVVTYKSLITIHYLMCYGNERFSQYMASHNSKFTLNNFMDKTGVQGIDMSSYIRKYAHYLNEKRETYKLMGFDFCKVKRGKDDGMLRTMSADKLIKALPILQKQVDALVQFDVAANELTNGVINSAFCLLSKDLIRLFACYNDGIINLLEKFFDMNKKMCKEALEIYKKFLERTDSVSAFLKVAESSGIDKSDIPDLAKAPSSLLDALEAHVNGPDTKKSSTSVSANNVSQNNTKSTVNNAINSLSNNNSVLSAEEQRRVLEEEAKTLESFKKTHLNKQTSLTSPSNENPFGKNDAVTTSNEEDLFGLDLSNTNTVTQTAASVNPTSNGSSASDDLLMLSGANPFIQNIVNQQQYQQPPNGNQMMNPFGAPNGMMAPQNNNQMNLFQQQAPPVAFGNQMMGNQNKLDDLFSGISFPSTTAVTTPLQPTSGSDLFDSGNDKEQETISTVKDSMVLNLKVDSDLTSDNTNMNKSNASFSFNSPNAGSNYNAISDFSEFDAFGDVLQPTTNTMAQSANPQNKTTTNGQNSDQKILSTDLESSLASLADNLDINRKNNNFQKNHQWNSSVPANQIKTGGQNWNSKPAMTPNTAPTLNSPMSAGWNAAPANPNAFNPFAAAIQPNPMAQPIQQPAQPVQSLNPFDMF